MSRTPYGAVSRASKGRAAFLAGMDLSSLYPMSVRGVGATCTPGEIWESDPGNTSGGACQPANRPSFQPFYGPSVAGAAWNQVGTSLDPTVRAALLAAGINIDCKEVCDDACLAEGMSPCCSTLCDVGDGGSYNRSAGLINANPNVLLTELNRAWAVPVAVRSNSDVAPASLPVAPQPTSALAPTPGHLAPSGSTSTTGYSASTVLAAAQSAGPLGIPLWGWVAGLVALGFVFLGGRR